MYNCDHVFFLMDSWICVTNALLGLKLMPVDIQDLSIESGYALLAAIKVTDTIPRVPKKLSNRNHLKGGLICILIKILMLCTTLYIQDLSIEHGYFFLLCQ